MAVELDFHIRERVVELEARMRARRHGPVRTFLHRSLRRFFADFDVNAWLGMYPMTFLETDEWRRVLPKTGGALLDVGAGSGDLTRSLAPLFDRVVCTETSRPMASKLERAGYRVHRLDLGAVELPEPTQTFDAVALLHVLDRCRAPQALFDRALSYARSGAAILVALPLPYDPWVDVGGVTVEPDQRLMPYEEHDVERARAYLERALFAERGLSLHAVARVPYLCPGDSESPFYSLDSFLFVAEKG